MTSTTPPTLPPYIPRPAGADTALGGLRVVDFTHFIAGPYGTQLLGDLGADVIKIENAQRGDEFRNFQPQIGGMASTFVWTNRNKRSVALDLTTEEGRAVARALVDKADVVAENFSGGVMRRFGLDYETVRQTNPQVIYCSVSAYGRDGPFADRTGFDPVTQAESGFMSLNGFADKEPVRTGPAVMDMSTAMMACNAMLAAIAARYRLGRGQYVEVPLFDTATVMVGFHATSHMMTGMEPTRFGNTSADSSPMGVFEASDGPIYLACASDRLFHRLMTEVLNRPEIAADPDYATAKARVPNRFKLIELLNGVLAGDTRANWVARMRAAGVPAGEVRTVSEAFASPEIRERNLVSAIPHPTAGTVPNVAPSFRFSETPIVDPVAAPTLGQHTDEVLREVLGYDAARLAALRAAGAFGAAKVPA